MKRPGKNNVFKPIVLFLAGLLISCFPTAPKAKPLVGLVISSLENPFFGSLRDGAVKEAAALGIELAVYDSANDSDLEVAAVRELLSKKPAVVLLNPTSSENAYRAIELANRQKVPVITLDREATKGIVASHVASDNRAGGRMAGEYLVKVLGGKGNVLELVGIQDTSAARDRGKGFEDAIAASDIRIVSRRFADFDRAKATAIMAEELRSQPAIDAVFAQNDEMALGALKVLLVFSKKAVVVGFDATAEALAALQSGMLAATIAQQPALIGILGVDTANALIKGQPVNAYVPVALQLVTK